MLIFIPVHESQHYSTEGLTWQTVKVENWTNMNFEGNTVAKQNNENL